MTLSIIKREKNIELHYLLKKENASLTALR